MRCKFIIYLAIAGVMFAGRPVIAADDLPLDEDQALMELYFGDEPSVEVATHVATPVSRIAENVTVINRAEIEAMHAHSVKEILRSVAGVRMDFDGYDLAGSGNISIHNSDVEHVLVLLDGVRWSFIDSDWNDTVAIPVGIIDRIEVIKGAASSSWGSSMGGVINIITRKAGISSTPVVPCRRLPAPGLIPIPLTERWPARSTASVISCMPVLCTQTVWSARPMGGLETMRLTTANSLWIFPTGRPSHPPWAGLIPTGSGPVVNSGTAAVSIR